MKKISLFYIVLTLAIVPGFRNISGFNAQRERIPGNLQAPEMVYLPLIVKSSVGTVRVHAVFDDGMGGAGESAGAGVVIRLNGFEVGTTDANGMLISNQPPGQYAIQAVLPSLAIGNQAVMVVAGQTVDVTVILDGNGEVIEPSDLVLDELVNGCLPFNALSITLRFVKNGISVAVSEIEEVELSSLNYEYGIYGPYDISYRFQLTPAGTVSAIDAMGVINNDFYTAGDVRLKVSATDARGFSHQGVVSFGMGLFQVDVQLAGPPSQPSLPVGGLPVHVRFGNGIEQTAIADSSGKVQLSQVPAGMLSVSVVTEAGGSVYTGVADIAVDGNKQLLVRMLGLTDIANGVLPWEVSPSLHASQLVPVQDRKQVQREATIAKETPATLPEAIGVAQVTVTAAGENVPVSGSSTLDVAKGTKKVILEYEVSTEEYPTYVLQQSRWNDTWRLSVLASSGNQLFSIARAVNSQLYSPPTWNSAGGTGKIQKEIDVSLLAAANDIQLTLAATATNIGDDILPTTVSASLGAEEKITIDAIAKDTVNPTRGQSDRYSIPRPGDANVFQRKFDVTFSKPDDVNITNAKVELLDDMGGVLQTVVDEAPGSPHVQLLNDTTLRIEVTFGNIVSQIASTPPPSDGIRYRFTLKGQKSNGDNLESEPKDSARYFALWRMPDGLPRYGQRDQGLDDWASQRTYNWLDNNRTLVTRIDDISGEHARNIGHLTHEMGRDIDMFHVYTFPGGAASGTQNYLRLKANVQQALAGNGQALALVNAWASDTRVRFDSLLTDNDVLLIFYAIGSAAQDQGLPRLGNGWARDLLETGTYTSPDGLVINLGAGAWGNAGNLKMRYNATHNNHFHITLSP